MKKFLQKIHAAVLSIPFVPVLMTAYMTYCIYIGPGIPDAIIFSFLCLLHGFKNYLDSCKRVDLTEDLINRVKRCEDGVSTVNIANKGLSGQKTKFGW